MRTILKLVNKEDMTLASYLNHDYFNYEKRILQKKESLQKYKSIKKFKFVE